MAYERTPIIESPVNTPLPTAPLPMREDRVVDPYKPSPRGAIPPQNGQVVTNSAPRVEETKPLTEDTVTLSPQVAALARKEQKFRQSMDEFKAKEKALEAERSEIAELKAIKAKLANKDYSGIENLVKYDEYTNYLIEKSGTTTPEQEAIRNLKADLDGLKNSQKENLEKAFNAAVSERRDAVKKLVDGSPEYPITKLRNMQEAVVQHILKSWEEDEVNLSPEQAAKEVETQLRSIADEWAGVLKTSAPEPVEIEEPAVKPKELPPLKPQIKTLTNNMAATGEVKRPLKPLYMLSDSERYAEARRRAEEKLKANGGRL